MTLGAQDDRADSGSAFERADFAERIESLKAGAVGGTAAVLGFAGLAVGNRWLHAPGLDSLQVLEWASLHGNGFRLLLSAATAALSGGLFGITYRYVIRQDQNPHLNSGAVLAFGLVRGLAQIDLGVETQPPLMVAAVTVTESLLLFAGARVALDWALKQKWLKPFTSDSTPRTH